mgnify:FL=1
MTTFDREDLLFQLFDVLRIDELLAKRGDDLDRAAVEDIIETSADIAAERFAPIASRMDEDEAAYVDGRVRMPEGAKEALAAYVDAGLLQSGFSEADGGLGLPETIHQAAAFPLATANISLAGFGLLTVGAGRLIASFGSDRQRETYLKPMAQGRFTGTMCLSEPHAGSSLADIKTRAEPIDGGRYRITGSKMWISGGAHELRENIVHLLLARIPGGPPGVKGISLFIVPRFEVEAEGRIGADNDVTLAGLNHKMGYRGLPNCALSFGDQGRCQGELVGEAHQGLRYMFQMMNEARIGVGMGATALGQAGFQASLAYARDRVQGRRLGSRDAEAGPTEIINHPDVRRLLLAQKAAVEPALSLALYCARLIDQKADAATQEERDRIDLLLDMLTPIAKSWPSEFCLEANKHAIQVLGGSGYVRDYPVERYYRDNRLNPIHEGTHGIQGLDLLGRKARMRGGEGLQLLLRTIRRDVDVSRQERVAVEQAVALSERLDRFERVTADLLKAAAHDPEAGLANATLYLDCAGHLVIAWTWLRILNGAARREASCGPTPFTLGKKQAAAYFFQRELPRTDVWMGTLEHNDQSAAQMDPQWF